VNNVEIAKVLFKILEKTMETSFGFKNFEKFFKKLDAQREGGWEGEGGSSSNPYFFQKFGQM
jgi:hypothetical protein